MSERKVIACRVFPFALPSSASAGSGAFVAVHVPSDSASRNPSELPFRSVYRPVATHVPAAAQEMSFRLAHFELSASAGSAGEPMVQLPAERISLTGRALPWPSERSPTDTQLSAAGQAMPARLTKPFC